VLERLAAAIQGSGVPTQEEIRLWLWSRIPVSCIKRSGLIERVAGMPLVIKDCNCGEQSAVVERDRPVCVVDLLIEKSHGCCCCCCCYWWNNRTQRSIQLVLGRQNGTRWRHCTCMTSRDSHGGATEYRVGQVGHGPPKILVGYGPRCIWPHQ